MFKRQVGGQKVLAPVVLATVGKEADVNAAAEFLLSGCGVEVTLRGGSGNET